MEMPYQGDESFKALGPPRFAPQPWFALLRRQSSPVRIIAACTAQGKRCLKPITEPPESHQHQKSASIGKAPAPEIHH